MAALGPVGGGVGVAGATVTVVNTDTPPTNTCCRYATAILSFLTGGGLLILGIVTVALLPDDGAIDGIWAGCLIALTGIIGVLQTKMYNNKALRATYISLGVIAAVVSVIVIIILAIKTFWFALTYKCNAAENNGVTINHPGGNFQINHPVIDLSTCSEKDTGVALHVVQMLFCGFEFIVAIVGASLTCACCCGKESSTTVNVAPQQLVQLA